MMYVADDLVLAPQVSVQRSPALPWWSLTNGEELAPATALLRVPLDFEAVLTPIDPAESPSP
jgi:hypothetical protein